MHQSQEADTTILHQGADVYHCPQDGTELLYVPKKGYHRCKSCKGVLLSAKAIDPKYAEKISQLNEIGAHQEVCPSCAKGANLSIHEVEYTYIPLDELLLGSRRRNYGTEYEIANVWLCNNCGSLWVPGVKGGAFKSSTAGLNLLFGYGWGGRIQAVEIGHWTWLDMQVKWREKRLEKEAKWCNHMDDQGEQCRKNKSQKSTHDPEYCYKHQPK